MQRGRTISALSIIAAALLLSAPWGLGLSLGQAPAHEPDVVYVPTPPEVVDAMLKLAEVKSTDIVYDLGSGDGRILITAAQKYGAHGVGIEIDPALVKTATANARAAGVSDKVRFITADLFETNLSEA